MRYVDVILLGEVCGIDPPVQIGSWGMNSIISHCLRSCFFFLKMTKVLIQLQFLLNKPGIKRICSMDC